MEKEKRASDVPMWFKVLLLIVALPLLAWPWLMEKATTTFGSREDDTLYWTFVGLLPLYIIGSAWISYRVYPSWPALAWVLQVVQVLTYGAMWLLVQGGSRIV